MKGNKNEEVQSRREFFKSAAKAALPVVGAVVLSSLPLQQMQASGCKYEACVGGCHNGCSDKCTSNCGFTCQNSCKNTCKSSSGR